MRRSKATSTADGPSSGQVRYRFVAGKGGVGKTTLAAALGLRSARAGRRTLIISTDPAPSLGDALGQRLGPRPRAVRGAANLYAVEVDAAAALGRWLQPRRELLEAIALRGTWLDRQDVSRLLTLSLPGIDEVAGLLEITALGASPRYDHIVVDTAPTGHLLRMLAMPAVLGGLARVFDEMQDRHRLVTSALRGGWTPDGCDRLIEEIGREAEAARLLLCDAERVRLTWVTLPEPMAVAETEDALSSLGEGGVAVDTIVVNRLTPWPRSGCGWCRTRGSLERRAVRSLLRLPVRRDIPIRTVPALDCEPRGLAVLAAVARSLEAGAPLPAPHGTTSSRRVRGILPMAGEPLSVPVITGPLRLLLFGGKGGVGKTTCAAATALAAALAEPRRRVLMLSADPAHSLGDVLGEPFSDDPRPLRHGPANLMVREMNAERSFAAIRAELADGIDRLMTRSNAEGSVALADDRQALRGLVDIAPPGIDELAAVIEVTESLVSGRSNACDLAIVDTAPTGHALRLLEMPSLVHDWVKAVMSILLKYRAVAGLGAPAVALLGLSQALGRFRSLLTDPIRTRFVVVTRPAALPRMETTRLVARLGGAGIAAPVVIINAAGAGTCARCRRLLTAERREITALTRELAKMPARPAILLAPAEMPSPHGPGALGTWREGWRELP